MVCAFLCQWLPQYHLGHAAIVTCMQGCNALGGCLLGKSNSSSSVHIKWYFPEGEKYQGMRRKVLLYGCEQYPLQGAMQSPGWLSPAMESNFYINTQPHASWREAAASLPISIFPIVCELLEEIKTVVERERETLIHSKNPPSLLFLDLTCLAYSSSCHPIIDCWVSRWFTSTVWKAKSCLWISAHTTFYFHRNPTDCT